VKVSLTGLNWLSVESVGGIPEYGEFLDLRNACSLLTLDFLRLTYLMFMYLVDSYFFTVGVILQYSVW
jgi:hypothetical protein